MPSQTKGGACLHGHKNIKKNSVDSFPIKMRKVGKVRYFQVAGCILQFQSVIYSLSLFCRDLYVDYMLVSLMVKRDKKVRN